MEKGKIIFLNGVTSSGKTSIVEALQERRDQFFYVVANDLFQEMVGEQYLEENYWKYLSEVIILMKMNILEKNYLMLLVKQYQKLKKKKD